MKPSEAFYSTIEQVTRVTSLIFSFGYDRIFMNDNVFIHVLFILGQFAKFVIGFPLGFIIGTFAAGIVAFINLFDEDDDIVIPNNVNPVINRAVTPVIEMKNIEPVIEIKVDIPTTRAAQPAPFPLDRVAKKTEEISRKSFAEKKRQLISSINLLTQFIDQKLIRVQPFVQPYEDSQQRIEDLKRQLATQYNIASSAKKFSHNDTKIDYKVSCLCGCTPGPGHMTLMCTFCKGPVVQKELRKTSPVYVADNAARRAAQIQSKTISLALDKEVKEYSQPPVECEIKKQLLGLNWQLQGILRSARTEKNDSNLLSVLLQYKNILSKAEHYLSTAEDHFSKADFTPKSDYAQQYVAVKMLQQAVRQNGLFQSIPTELQERVALFTTPSTFSEEDARHIFNHS